VLDGAEIQAGETLLDVGAGDGLIAFGALERGAAHVTFSDASEDLLEHARALATELGVHERCSFVLAEAQDLEPFENASFDVVTTRSVVIYVPFQDKRRALAEFHRVLREGGRLSMFEPINSFAYPEPDGRFYGMDTGPVGDLAEKVKAHYREVAAAEDTLTDFDERDLLRFAEDAGFTAVELDLEARVQEGLPPAFDVAATWERLLAVSGNPLAPTLGEALDGALTADERQRFEDYFRPLFDSRQMRTRSALAYLRARKGERQ
jgi:ubiquinone/menaquinone biosynthesis C-methylase UbiE